jgi:hypothetical protein
MFAAGPVYVLLWFDTEDYIEPASDDAALRIADDLTRAGVRATFKVVGEKARILEARGRKDVIRSLSHHAIGYHSNWHSLPPVPAVYLQHLGYLEGADEFQRREEPGASDVLRIFGVNPICYGQPGSSWGPQANLALRRMNIPVYLDEGTHVGIKGQPFWYGGLLYIFNMGSNLIRANLDRKDGPPYKRFDAIVHRLSTNGGGVISTYYHPNEFVTTEFWDAVNFSKGAVPERAEWRRPTGRTSEDSERCYRILREYVEHAKAMQQVRFVTAEDVLQLYEGPIPPAADLQQIAEHLSRHIVFLETPAGTFSPADMLLQLLHVKAETVDGPTGYGVTTVQSSTIRPALLERAAQDAASFIRMNPRLPSEVFIGSETLSLADFAATLAMTELSPNPIRLVHGSIEFDQYFATDPKAAFDWVIHPEGFAAPELLDLARLHGWTLKPARLR